jgi:hypothetical protein
MPSVHLGHLGSAALIKLMVVCRRRVPYVSIGPLQITEDSLNTLDDGDMHISHHLSHGSCYLHDISAASLERPFDIFVEACRYGAQ